MADLFSNLRPEVTDYGNGALLFAGLADGIKLFGALDTILVEAPLRHMKTPGGHTMAVATSNCGPLGWVSGPKGYEYSCDDPLSGALWPQMPRYFSKFATMAADKAGFPGFQPDCCLINRYDTGTSLSPHQDSDECDMRWPIVSVSIGVPAVYQLFGEKRGGSPTLIDLFDGDVLVLGGVARSYFHGIKKIKPDLHPTTGHYRFNLTFRRAR